MIETTGADLACPFLQNANRPDDVAGKDVEQQIALDVYDVCPADAHENLDSLSLGNSDDEIGVRVESRTVAPDVHAILEIAPGVAERTIIANSEARARRAQVGIHDPVRGIDDPERLAFANRSGLDLELRGIGTRASDLDDHGVAGSGDGAHAPREVVDRDGRALD